MPIGGEPIKYEMDKASGALKVDRFLYTSMRYPGNYGFIPHTLSDDGDPCDVIVANTRAIIPGAIMSCRIVGVLLMEDEAGGDEKLLAVPSAKLTQRYARVNNFTDLPEITLKQIEHFFAHYKDLEPGKWVKIVRWGDAEEARRLVNEGIARALAKGEGAEEGASMKRSFVDARIEAMLGACARHGQRCRRSRCGARTIIAPIPPPRGASPSAGSAGTSSSSSPARSPPRASACSPCAWATGAASPTGAAGSTPKRRCTPRTASARRITTTSSRPKTSSIAAAAASSSSWSRSIAAGAPLKERFRAVKDVKTLDLGPGDRVTLEPGESLTLEPFVAHAFWAEGGAVLAGEVSLVNDDASDNYFLPPLAAPAPIEEDRPKRYVTVRDHSRFVALAG